jgi:hypothetical protein
MLGIGFVGNENVYIAGIVKFNDFITALMLVPENEIFNDITNQLIRDIKKTWQESTNVAAFNVKVNQLGKGRYRIMPFSIVHTTETKDADVVVEELKLKCIKFFKKVEVYKKDKNPEAFAIVNADVEEQVE